MRAREFVGVLSMVVLLPILGNAQVSSGAATPPPAPVEYAEWQFNGEPMLFAGLVYYPTRGTRFFDGNTMAQVGIYRSVPVYVDSTRPPNSVVYVPVGRGQLRAYEANASRDAGRLVGALVPREAPEPPREAASSVGTSGALADVPRPARTHMESIARPNGSDGVWLEFQGTRWYSNGPAVAFVEQRFVRIGEHRGFGVYREATGPSDRIWVQVVEDGPVAPYAKRH